MPDATTLVDWPTFYAGREGPDYLAYVKGRYAPFIEEIQMAMCRSTYLFATTMELGAGTGTITKALVDGFPSGEHYMIDKNPRMLDIAMARVKKDRSVYGLIGDITKERFSMRACVVHSHGVLEHFTDDEIRYVRDSYKEAVHVHYVPGLYPSPSFGDERLMTVEQWQDILRIPVRVKTFHGGLDYILIWGER